jgi:hypothetical protein
MGVVARLKYSQVVRERFALACAALMTGLCFYLVPSWEPVALLSDPCGVATIASGVVVMMLIATLLSGRGIRIERIVLSLFLAAMPLIYLARGRLFGGLDSGGWLWIESIGLLIFGALAWLGYYRSPWFLALGIAAHGMLWDSWHFHSAYIPSWYALGCLLVDVGLGFYVVVRMSAWRTGAGSHSPSPF